MSDHVTFEELDALCSGELPPELGTQVEDHARRCSSWIISYWLSAKTCRRASARFWEIITKVERKIASRLTIIVSNPYGYFSTGRLIHVTNHAMWT